MSASDLIISLLWTGLIIQQVRGSNEGFQINTYCLPAQHKTKSLSFPKDNKAQTHSYSTLANQLLSNFFPGHKFIGAISWSFFFLEYGKEMKKRGWFYSTVCMYIVIFFQGSSLKQRYCRREISQIKLSRGLTAHRWPWQKPLPQTGKLSLFPVVLFSTWMPEPFFLSVTKQ